MRTFEVMTIVCRVYSVSAVRPRAFALTTLAATLLAFGCASEGEVPGPAPDAGEIEIDAAAATPELVRPIVPKPAALSAIWGSAANDVWAVGAEGTIMHYDGKELSLIESGTQLTLLAVTGTGPNDVWIVGEQGLTLHWDGTQVRQVAMQYDQTLLGVWANSPDDVWAVGFLPLEKVGLVRHWDGTEWHELAIPTVASLWEVWGSGPDNVWVVGTSHELSGAVLHAVGNEITQLEFKGQPLRGVWGTSVDDVWVLPYDSPLQHWDGASFTAEPTANDNPMLGMWGASPDDVWAVGLYGMILHYDGSKWERSTSSADVTLWSVWGSAPDDVWIAGGGGTLLRWDGEAWTTLEIAPGDPELEHAP